MLGFLFRQRIYKQTFFSDAGKKVLEDLGAFCYLDRTTADVNPQNQARKEGRREVMLFIMQTLKLKVDDIGDSDNVRSDNHSEYID